MRPIHHKTKENKLLLFGNW